MNSNSKFTALSFLWAYAQGLYSKSTLLRQIQTVTLQPATTPMEQGAVWLLQALLQPQAQPERSLLQAYPQIQNWLQLFPTHQQLVLARLCSEMFVQVAECLPEDLSAAVQLAEYACVLAPQEKKHRWFLCQMYLQAGDLSKALAALHALTATAPGFWPAWSLKAHLMIQQGQAEQALKMYQQLQGVFPQSIEVLLGLGNLYQIVGDFEAARRTYYALLSTLGKEAASIELKEQLAGVWNNLGRLEQQTGRWDRAAGAFLEALEHNPQMPEAHLNLGRLGIDLEDWSAAEGHLLQALNQLGDRVETAEICWLYARLQGLMHRDLAERYQERAIQHAPQRIFWRLQQILGFPEQLFLGSTQDQNRWAERVLVALNADKSTPVSPQILQQELAFLPETLWSLHYLTELSSELRLQLKRALAEKFVCVEPVPIKQKKGPLRLGILVSEHHEGIFKMQQGGLLMLLPPERFVPVLIGRQSKLQDCSHPNLERMELSRDILAAAKEIRDLDLDLLYYWEVGSDVLNYFLPFLRPAPVQLTSWGTPSKTGIEAMDYYISNRWMLPDAVTDGRPDGGDFEQSVVLAHLPGYFSDPAPQAGQKNRRDLGLPEGPMLLCLQNVLKYSPSFIEALVQIMAALPEAQLVLLRSTFPWIQTKVEGLVDSLMGKRVHWLATPIPRADYLNVIAHAELVLDTFGISGCQSHLDALAMGVPVVTLIGKSTSLRFTTALYQQMGCAELLKLQVGTEHDYVELVKVLMSDVELRHHYARKIQSARKFLFDDVRGAQDFAEALWQIALLKGLRSQ